jgi:hypothetical protein
MSTDGADLVEDYPGFSNVSPKHNQLTQEQCLAQSQYCLHNIVGERIFPSRVAEFGAKFLVRATLRHRDRKADQYIRGSKAKLNP